MANCNLNPSWKSYHTQSERGLLGIAVEKNMSIGGDSDPDDNGRGIFLYYTESAGDEGEGELKNRVYKYTWNGQTLENPTLISIFQQYPVPIMMVEN